MIGCRCPKNSHPHHIPSDVVSLDPESAVALNVTISETTKQPIIFPNLNNITYTLIWFINLF